MTPLKAHDIVIEVDAGKVFVTVRKIEALMDEAHMNDAEKSATISCLKVGYNDD